MGETSLEFYLSHKKNLLKSVFSSADIFLDPLKITVIFGQHRTLLTDPTLSFFAAELGAWLSHLKAWQTAQISAKTCSTRSGWSN